VDLAGARLSSGEVRAVLERHRLLARRDLGQNFLCDEGLADRLVALAGVESGDSVVEIGTGLGLLTRALAARAARVVTLEVDAGLVRALRAEDLLPPHAELIHADVLRTDLRGLVAGCTPPVRLVANLPYSAGRARLTGLRLPHRAAPAHGRGGPGTGPGAGLLPSGAQGALDLPADPAPGRAAPRAG
jgi:16S rRNA (adenine1518-N6/adenine1519-N6)-dimethyltransferase